jgi:hypothetical protein
LETNSPAATAATATNFKTFFIALSLSYRNIPITSLDPQFHEPLRLPENTGRSQTPRGSQNSSTKLLENQPQTAPNASDKCIYGIGSPDCQSTMQPAQLWIT